MRSFSTALVSFALASVAAAQGYPEKTVVMIAPFPAGGSVDLVARAIAQHMSDAWKQPVIVSNRPGASGNIGAEAVARAAPDGYTLLMGTTALAGSPTLYPKLGYDVLRDLAPVSLVVTMMNVLVVHPRCRRPSVKALLALARAKPGALVSASAGVGSSNHLALVLFNMMSGANIGHVPYKGAAPAVADVMGGHVSMTFAPIAAALPPVRGGEAARARRDRDQALGRAAGRADDRRSRGARLRSGGMERAARAARHAARDRRESERDRGGQPAHAESEGDTRDLGRRRGRRLAGRARAFSPGGDREVGKA